jgi:hypothetical protein
MRKWIVVAAAATAALVWFAPDDDSVVVSTAAATPSASRASPMETAGSAALPRQELAIPPELQIQRRLEDEDAGNLFAGSGAPVEAPLKPSAARAAVQAEAPAGAPAANGPALAILGSYRDGGKTVYLLQADGQDIVARVGDVVQGAYRLDSGTDGTLSVTYLPSNQPMTLALTHAPGETN